MHLDTKIIISFQVLCNKWHFGIEINIHMKLETNTMDRAPTVFQVFDQIVGCISPAAVPATIHGHMTVVIIEKLCIWVSFMSPLECLANEIVDLDPGCVFTDVVWRSILDCLVDDVPGKGFALVSFHSRLDVALHEVFDFLGILLLLYKVWIKRIFRPERIVTPESHVVLLGEIHDQIASAIVEISPGFGNWLHFASAYGCDEVELLYGHILVLLVYHASFFPLFDGSAHIDSKTLGCIFKANVVVVLPSKEVSHGHVTK